MEVDNEKARTSRMWGKRADVSVSPLPLQGEAERKFGGASAEAP